MTVDNINHAIDQKQMRKAIGDIETTLGSIRKLADQIAKTVDQANLGGTTTDIRQLAESLKNSSESLQISLKKANETMDSMTDLVHYLNENPSSLIRGRGNQPDQD